MCRVSWQQSPTNITCSTLVILYRIIQYVTHITFPHTSFFSLVLLPNSLNWPCTHFISLPQHTGPFHLQHIIGRGWNRMILEDDFQIGSLPWRFDRSTTASYSISICCQRWQQTSPISFDNLLLLLLLSTVYWWVNLRMFMHIKSTVTELS